MADITPDPSSPDPSSPEETPFSTGPRHNRGQDQPGAGAITLSERRDLDPEAILALYRANKWSSADKPDELYKALTQSHALVSAWDGDRLVGIGNAISDGHLVVYYPHLLVHPDYQGRGIGQSIFAKMQEKYGGFHMQMLTADGKAVDFYKKMGFVRAGQTEPMWIYKGGEH